MVCQEKWRQWERVCWRIFPAKQERGENRRRNKRVPDILKVALTLRGDGSSEVARKRQFRVLTSWTVSLGGLQGSRGRGGGAVRDRWGERWRIRRK